jgi:hypothetical protein
MENTDDSPLLTPPLFTVDEIIHRLSQITDEQRSLAWSPEPPYVSSGAGDCRPGGNCGLNFNPETPRSRWIRARFRWRQEQQKISSSSALEH